METEDFMTARDFAKLVNRPYPTIAQWLRDGRIPGAVLTDIGALKVWMIPKEALIDFKLPQMGRPKDVKDSKKRAKKTRKSSKKGTGAN
jgi:Helix-turn-helix domain